MTEREAKYLGAFLHDIGKFIWKSQEYHPGKDHERLGTALIKSYFKDASVVNGDNVILNLLDSAGKRASGNVKLADIIDASTDREYSESRESRRPLISILSRINIGKAPLPTQVYYYDPDPLKFEAQKPQNGQTTEEDWKVDKKEMIEKHANSYKNFQNDLQKIKHIADFRTFFSSFYSICEKYLTYISSASYKTVPDISLFDHSKMVAALWICIEEGDKDNECLMIKGDISGIQKFIYNELEMTENVAKVLRGRSFFVRILSDAVANYIMRKLDLWEANVFFNNGGHFVMIAPNNMQNRERLVEIERTINLQLFKACGTNLQLVIGSIQEESKKLLEKFPEKMQELEAVLQEMKRKKCFSILEDIMLQPISAKKESKKFNKYRNIFDKLGEKLPKSNYLIQILSSANTSEKIFSEVDINLANLNLHYLLVDEKKLKDTLYNLDGNNPYSMIIYNISDTEITRSDVSLNLKNPLGYSFKFTGSYIPIDKESNKPLTFEEIAKKNSENYPLLGIARMDVDSLGAIFAYGLKFVKRRQDEKSIYTPTRLSFLSREMNHFFSGTIEKIAEESDIYLVYSGGDDLFAVGSWVNIIKFVKEVRDKFCEFACNNMNLTLSGGVVIEKDDFPIAYSARSSGEELEKAKSIEGWEMKREGIDDNQKDRIAIFGRKVKWEKFEELIKIGNNLHDVVKKQNKKEQLPRSFIHTLLETTQQCFDKKGRFQVEKVWQATSKIHYHFARRGVDAQELEKKKLDYKTTFAEYFLKKEPRELENWYEEFVIPASYVLLKTRKTKK